MKLIFCIVLSLMMFLPGCSYKNNLQNSYNGDYFNLTMQATETILICLSENDAKGIKDLLCVRAKELPDIDEQIQTALDYFDGKAISYDEEEGKSVEKLSGAKDNGEWTETTAYGQIPGILTDTGNEYKELYVFYCAIDARQPDLIGINTIIIKGTDGTECSVGL